MDMPCSRVPCSWGAARDQRCSEACKAPATGIPEDEREGGAWGVFVCSSSECIFSERDISSRGITAAQFQNSSDKM